MKSTATVTAGAFANVHLRHVVAAGLALLAAVAAIGAAAWVGDGSGGTTAPFTGAPGSQVRAAAEPEMSLYLVRTQAQADSIRLGQLDAARTREGFGIVEWDERVEIIVADGPYADQAIAEAIYVREGLGLSEINVYDLR